MQSVPSIWNSNPHINLSSCGLVEVEIKKANIVTCDGNICSHTRHVGLLEIDRRSYDEESEKYMIFKALSNL